MYSTAEKEGYGCDVIYTATIISIFITGYAIVSEISICGDRTGLEKKPNDKIFPKGICKINTKEYFERLLKI